MSIYTDFYKFLLCLVLVCLCVILLLRLREKFVDDKLPKKNNVIVSTNNNKSKLILQWSKSDERTLGYVIIMFKNNDGPYFIYPDKYIDLKNNEFLYNYQDPTMNVRYKFVVVGYNNYGVSPVDKFSEVLLTPSGLDLKYVDSAYSKVTCYPDGSFYIGDKCVTTENIQAIEKDDGKNKDFSDTNHETLMRDLSNKQSIKFNF